ncbi:MAG TPA: VWA domain-containing protein [Longimicrobiales bacterium]
MGFLAPALLGLGLAVTIPLVLHLLHRHHGPRVVFPALRYLRRAERESARRVRLRQILLLLLRIGAVLLVAAAAARPFLHSGGLGHVPTAVVIILDNSMSAGAVIDDERVLEVLKARALETLEGAKPEDRFWLLRAGAPDEPAYPGDAVAIARLVRETEPTSAGADISAVIARAGSILQSGAAGRAQEIHVLSDMQSSGFPARVPANNDASVIVWRPRTEVPPNRSVTAVTIGGGIAPGANERSSVSATVAGTAGDTVNVRLLVDDRLAAAGRTAAGGTVVLNLPARPSGLLTGWVEMDADALRADNRRYFATEVTPSPSVAVVGALPFVREAVGALETAGRVRAGGASADVVIAAGEVPPGARGSGRMAVVLPPESPLEAQALNRRLAVAGIPWSFVPQTAAGEARFRMADSTDAVLRTLQSARLRNVYRLQPAGAASGDSVLLRLADGGPWAVRGRYATGGGYILIASPMTEGATSIPTSAAMLPLLDRIIRTWSAFGGSTGEAEPGGVFELPAEAAVVVRPDSVQEPVRGGRYEVPPVAGIYEYRTAAGPALGAFAVNPPASESDLRVIPRDRFEALLEGWTVRTPSTADEWKRDIFRDRLGRELVRPLLLALLLLLVVEAGIAASGGFRRRAP